MPYPIAATMARGSKGQNAAIYLLRDEFTTDRAAGAVNGTAAEPGPGNRTVNDVESVITVATGKLTFANPATPVHSDEYVVYPAVARATGLMAYSRFGYTAAGSAYPLGLCNAVVPSGAGNGNFTADFYIANIIRVQNAVAGITEIGAVASGTEYQLALVLRSIGTHFLIKGGAFTAWTLLWSSVNDNTATLYPAISQYNGAFTVDDLRVAQLGAPWVADYGIITQRLAGARSAGDTFAHEANTLIEFTATTVPAALQIELRFRIQDATNYWQVTVDSTGALDLDEVVAGVVTQRGTAAGMVANGDRIVIVADSTTIKVYEAGMLRITYALAANFATETDGELWTEGTGGAVTDIISWPRTLSGAALAELEKYTA